MRDLSLRVVRVVRQLVGMMGRREVVSLFSFCFFLFLCMWMDAPVSLREDETPTMQVLLLSANDYYLIAIEKQIASFPIFGRSTERKRWAKDEEGEGKDEESYPGRFPLINWPAGTKAPSIVFFQLSLSHMSPPLAGASTVKDNIGNSSSSSSSGNRSWEGGVIVNWLKKKMRNRRKSKEKRRGHRLTPRIAILAAPILPIRPFAHTQAHDDEGDDDDKLPAAYEGERPMTLWYCCPSPPIPAPSNGAAAHWCRSLARPPVYAYVWAMRKQSCKGYVPGKTMSYITAHLPQQPASWLSPSISILSVGPLECELLPPGELFTLCKKELASGHLIVLRYIQQLQRVGADLLCNRACSVTSSAFAHVTGRMLKTIRRTFCAHFPLALQIAFVADNDDGEVVSILDAKPSPNIEERDLIVDHALLAVGVCLAQVDMLARCQWFTEKARALWGGVPSIVGSYSSTKWDWMSWMTALAPIAARFSGVTRSPVPLARLLLLTFDAIAECNGYSSTIGALCCVRRAPRANAGRRRNAKGWLGRSRQALRDNASASGWIEEVGGGEGVARGFGRSRSCVVCRLLQRGYKWPPRRNGNDVKSAREVECGRRVQPNWKEVQPVSPVQQVEGQRRAVSGLLLPEVGQPRSQPNLVLNPQLR
ncbi:hypothetical protein KC327_g96 [Hortaea werneckii]|nr:hypothetical protein KC327_g96 [Hortaea werneckii]